MRDHYAQRWQARSQRIEETLKHNRIDTAVVSTEGDYVAELIKLFKRLFLLSLLLAQTAMAQIDTPRVMARVEPDSVFIGDRFDYVIEIEKDLVQVVEFPEFVAPPSGAVELIEECPVDTLLQEGRRLQLRKRYRLAAFEEGILNMGVGGVLFADKNIIDTL